MSSARNVSFNSQYNFKVIILFYLLRVGRVFGATKMFNYENRHTSASDFKVFKVSTMFASLTAGLVKNKHDLKRAGVKKVSALVHVYALIVYLRG